MTLPTWLLHLEARTIRALIDITQTYFSRPIYWYYSHTPLEPSCTIQIPSKTSPHKGTINLVIYTPPTYDKTETSTNKKTPKLHPLIVNFHGGGFVLGRGIDDERWARSLTTTLDAIVVSVEYRLAPDYTFPTALHDSVDAIAYLHSNAASLKIDTSRIITTGFSSGGSLAITVPMYLKRELGIHCKGLVTWYPATDATRSRDERAKSMKNPDKKLPKWITDIFDAAHPHPRKRSGAGATGGGGDLSTDLRNPYRSPGLAEDHVLRESLPPNVLVYTCEHDMLCQEARQFAERLENGRIVDRVVYREVENVKHAWDKGPNPQPPPEKIYGEACRHLKEIFEQS